MSLKRSMAVMCFALTTFTVYTSHSKTSNQSSSRGDAFVPVHIWRDDSGKPINAHGGGFLLHDGIYYWFGEHKVAGTKGNSAQIGVHVYSSRNLYD